MPPLLILVLTLISTAAFAHKPSDSYLALQLTENRVQGQWDIALRDLDYAIGLDGNGDGAITWAELRQRHPAIAVYALSHLNIFAGNQPCPTTAQAHLVDNHTDGAYAVLKFTAACPKALAGLTVDYQLFFDLDPQHKGLLRFEHGKNTQTAIFSADSRSHKLNIADASAWREFLSYGREGVWHIWIGYDHILFLLSLLLPAVLYREADGWQAVGALRPALLEIIKIVTAFTLAHSFTLSLAALQVIELPSRLVESAIAASVVIVALNNLYPVIRTHLWTVAFVFGLVHGLGFANVLADLALPKSSLLLALVGFNLGVETGQLAIVGAFLPLAYTARKTMLYQRWVFGMGSLVIALIATIWLVERSLNLDILSQYAHILLVAKMQ